MAEWNRDRGGRYGGRTRDDQWYGREDSGYGSAYGEDRYGGSRWGSGDYRQNYDRSGWRDEMTGGGYETDRDEFAGERGGGYLGGGYGRTDFSRRDYGTSGMPGGDYGRGSDVDRDYDRWSDRDRNRGIGGTRFEGGGAGTDFETTPGAGFGVDRSYDRERYGRMGGTARQSFRGRGPKGFQRSDERLREMISERLEDHDEIDASDIEVKVSNGEVTLTGTVDGRHTKRLAEDVADSVIGVRDVHNNLKVDKGFFSRMADSVRNAVQGGGENTTR